jgi:cephalosporin hydroxylase
MSASLPPRVEIGLDDRVGSYWSARVEQHLLDSYVGVPLLKFPEDLRTYEHILWSTGANAVIELGCHSGGSALWFRDRLRTFASYRGKTPYAVVSVDVDIDHARRAVESVDPSSEGLTLLQGDVTDARLPELVASHLPEQSRCMVVDDSAHTYATTSAALRGFAGFVSRGCFFVVEDGCVDVEGMRVDPNWPRGVIPAIEDFLSSPPGRGFTHRRELELYGITCHVRGYLQRD